MKYLKNFAVVFLFLEGFDVEHLFFVYLFILLLL